MTMSLETAAESIPVEDLGEIIAIDRQIKDCLIQLGEIEVQAETQKDQIKLQLSEVRRKQGFEHNRLMQRYKIPEGSVIDFVTGSVTLPKVVSP